MKQFIPIRLLFSVFLTTSLVLTACSPIMPAGTSPTGTSPTPSSTSEVIFYDWVNDLPESVFEGFTKEYGIPVRYVSYDSQEEAIENMKAGTAYDIVVLDNQFIPDLSQSGMLRQINYQNIPNFKYVSANFRDLVYDPSNHFSIPYNWGSTGLVVRSDLAKGPITRWSDLWNQETAGKVLLWRGVERQMMGMALKSLGYSANSENPAELEQALERLLTLKGNAIFAEDKDATLESSAPLLINGDTVLAVGWSHDVLEGRTENAAITYVLPEEGALLWGDNFIIPVKNTNQTAAEMLLNYLLRPEISAQITNYNSYPTANEKARDFVNPQLRDDPLVYPKNEDLKNAEIILPLSMEAQKLHEELWQRFLNAP